MAIPIKHTERKTIIGFCRRGPFDGHCDLPIFPKRADVLDDSDGDVLVRQAIRVRLVYDARKHCYWANSHDCLSHPDVEPY